MIFDKMVDFKRNSRLVIGGHVVKSTENEVYASTLKSVSARILTKIAVANNLDFMTGDIDNSYLITNTEEKMYTRAGADFEVVYIMADRSFLEFVKALYCLPTLGTGGTDSYHISQGKWVLSRPVLTLMPGLEGASEVMIILEPTLMMSSS